MGTKENKNVKRTLTKEEFSSLLESVIREELQKLLKEEEGKEVVRKKGPPVSSARKLAGEKLSTLKDFASFAAKEFPKMSSSLGGLLSRIQDSDTDREAQSHVSALLGGRDGELAGNLSRLADLFYDKKFLQRKLSGKDVSKELERSEENPEAYAGTLRAAADLENEKNREKREYSTAEGPNQLEWGQIGKLMGTSLQAAQQSFEKSKEKLQTFLDGDFDAAEYKAAADELLNSVGLLAFQVIKNSIVALSQAPEDVEGVLDAEIQKFFSALQTELSSMTKYHKVVIEGSEQDFWRNLFANAIDMILGEDEEGTEEISGATPEEVETMIRGTIRSEFYRGWDERKLADLSDLIQDTRREVVFTLSKNAAAATEEGIAKIKQLAPDMSAASAYVMENPEQFPEVVNRVADRLRSTIQQLADQNRQSSLGSVQDAISKSIYFPAGTRGKKPKKDQ